MTGSHGIPGTRGPFGPVGPLDLAFGPFSIWTQVIPSFSTIFSVARVVEKSTVMGIQAVDSMNPWRVWAHHSFNKDCSQSFSGPSGRPKEPTTGPTFSPFFFSRLGVRKVDPLGDSIRRLPDPLGDSGQIFVQQRLPPELPRATGPRQGAHKSPNIFTKIMKKSRTELRSQNLIF